MARTAIDAALTFQERRRLRYLRRGERHAREQLMDLMQGLAVMAAALTAYGAWWWLG